MGIARLGRASRIMVPSGHDLHDIGGRIVFLAYDNGPMFGMPNLWQSDGTAAGTQLFADPQFGDGWRIFGAVNGRILYQQTFTRPYLWSTDGSASSVSGAS